MIGLLVPALVLLCQGQPGRVVSWGTSIGGPYEPKPGDEYMAVCAGGFHSLALTAEGTLVAWGENTYGQCNVPLGNDFVAIAAGQYHNLALRVDGTVAAWGDNSRGQCNVPPRTKFLAVAAGTWHSLGIRLDGTLVAWGRNEQGQCDVPPGRDYIDVCGGYYHSLALKVDRSLVAWGGNGDGQCNVPAGNDFVDIAAGALHSLALRADGTVVAWGRSSEGQGQVPTGARFIAIAAGSLHSLALRADGHVVAWGQNDCAQCDTPKIDHVAIIAAGGFHSLAIQENRPHTTLPADLQAPAAQPILAFRATNAPAPEPAPIAQRRPLETPEVSKPADKGTSEKQVMAAQAGPPAVAATRETQVPPTPPANAEKREPDRPAPRVAKPSATPAAEPNTLDLDDAIRQALSTNLYMDSSQRAVPVYHFTSMVPAPGPGAATQTETRQHFCTISEEEKYKLIDTQAKTWKYEGIAFFAYAEGRQPPGSRPIYRFWSQSLNRYFFTMDENQKQMLIDKLAQVWTYQGVAWYAPPAKPNPK